jgi:hypothetical protein
MMIRFCTTRTGVVNTTNGGRNEAEEEETAVTTAMTSMGRGLRGCSTSRQRGRGAEGPLGFARGRSVSRLAQALRLVRDTGGSRRRGTRLGQRAHRAARSGRRAWVARSVGLREEARNLEFCHYGKLVSSLCNQFKWFRSYAIFNEDAYAKMPFSCLIKRKIH